MTRSPRSRLRPLLAALIGSALSVALLAWILRGTDWREVGAAAADTPAWAVVASALLFCCCIPLRALQWRWLLEGEVGFKHAAWGICLGYTTNCVVPARGGEVARAWLMARWEGLPFSRVLASNVLARLMDLPAIGAILGLTLVVAPLADGVALAAGTVSDEAVTLSRDSLDRALRLFGGAVVAAALATLAAYVLRGHVDRVGEAAADRISPRVGGWWRAGVSPAVRALDVIRRPGHLAAAFGIGLVCWLLFLAAPLPMLLALGLDLRLALVTTVTFTGLTTLMQMVPAVPTALGTFHVACLASLYVCAPDLDPAVALAFTLLVHPVDTMATGVPGLFLLPSAWTDLRIAHRAAAGDALAGSET